MIIVPSKFVRRDSVPYMVAMEAAIHVTVSTHFSPPECMGNVLVRCLVSTWRSRSKSRGCGPSWDDDHVSLRIYNSISDPMAVCAECHAHCPDSLGIWIESPWLS